MYLSSFMSMSQPLLDYTVCLHASMHLNSLCSYAVDVYLSAWPDSDACRICTRKIFNGSQVRLTMLHRSLCFILNAENDLKGMLKYTEGHGGI